MTYPRKTTASLAADYFVFAVYVGVFGFILAVFFLVFALGDLRLSRTDPIVAEVMEKTVQQHSVGTRSGETRTRLVNWVDLELINASGEMVRFGLSPRVRTY